MLLPINQSVPNHAKQININTYSGTTYEDNVYFTAPYLSNERTEVKITVSFTDVTGYVRSINRKITVIQRNSPLIERSGVLLYCDSEGDTRQNAYCFSEMRPVIDGLVAPSLVDLYIPSIDELELPDPSNPPVVVREWRTMTDLNFARSNSFDFSNANSLNIASAYESSVRAPRITNLQSGDIVLVGREGVPMGVIQVVDVIEGATIVQSRYIINIKAIKDATPLPETPDEPEDPSEEVTGDSE